MNKLISLLILSATLTSSAIASTVTPYIRVKDLKAKTPNGEEVIMLKGGDAYKLLDVLPMNSPYNGSRELTISGNKRSITINCVARTITVNENTSTIDPSTTECRIAVGKSMKPEQAENPQIWKPNVEDTIMPGPKVQL